MQTLLLKCIEDAATILRAGGLVAFPTETVFGLGVDARDEAALERLFWAKGRPADNPLIVHLADVSQWSLAARELPASAARILEAFAPGPVTVVVPKHSSICAKATGGLDTVGIRIPAAPTARELLRLANIPVAAPSANRSGRPSCTTWRSVVEDLDGRIDAILAMDELHVGLESSVVDCTGPVPRLLRPGAVGLWDLQQLFPETQQLAFSGEHHPVNSPGLRYAHYQPRAQVLLFDEHFDWQSLTSANGQLRFAYCGMLPLPQQIASVLTQTYSTVEAYAQGFYEFLREADRQGADLVLVQLVQSSTPSELREGLGAALRDRQRRAAGQA